MPDPPAFCFPIPPYYIPVFAIVQTGIVVLGILKNKVMTTIARHRRASVWALAMLFWLPASLFALDPHKSLSQYSRTFWTQQDGLPQDTIRAAVQTRDGYLWLGTDEGLARFDGYEFTVFTKANGDLPSNSVTALAADTDGSVWIGTSNGLAHFRDGKFQTYSIRQGLPDNNISMLYEDHADTLWIVRRRQSVPVPGRQIPDFRSRP